MSDTAKDNLQHLLESPGWAMVTDHIKQEWGAGGARFEGFIDSVADSRQDDPIVLQQIRQIAVARREILRLVKWPEEEVARLIKLELAKEAPIRQPLAPELVWQSRRGTL